MAVVVTGISGANTGSPFDGNAAIPNAYDCGHAYTATSCANTISTNNANDIILAFSDFYSTSTYAITVPSSFTELQGVAYYGTWPTSITASEPATALYYETVSSTQSGLSITWSSSQKTRIELIADAVKQAVTGVTQGVQVTVANGGTSGTSFSLSGCGTGSDPNSTFTADGYTHTYTSVTASCSITVTVKTDASYTRYRFGDLHPSTAVKTWVFTSCSSGSCTNSNTTYYQLKNSYTCAPSSTSKWDGVYACTATGTYVSVSNSTASVNTANNGGSVTISGGWYDYNQAVSLPATLGTIWVPGTHSWTDTTGNNARTATYAGNLAETYSAGSMSFSTSYSPTGTGAAAMTYSAGSMALGTSYSPTGTGATAMTYNAGSMAPSTSYSPAVSAPMTYATDMTISTSWALNQVDAFFSYSAGSMAVSDSYTALASVLGTYSAGSMAISATYSTILGLAETYATSMVPSVSYANAQVNASEGYATTVFQGLTYLQSVVVQGAYGISSVVSVADSNLVSVVSSYPVDLSALATNYANQVLAGMAYSISTPMSTSWAMNDLYNVCTLLNLNCSVTTTVTQGAGNQGGGYYISNYCQQYPQDPDCLKTTTSSTLGSTASRLSSFISISRSSPIFGLILLLLMIASFALYFKTQGKKAKRRRR
jgi:hypothetical protein